MVAVAVVRNCRGTQQCGWVRYALVVMLQMIKSVTAQSPLDDDKDGGGMF